MDADVVFDGYCDPIYILSHRFSCKPVCLKIHRRRYRQNNKDEHFGNEYNFTPEGTKIVPEPESFLKRRRYKNQGISISRKNDRKARN
jgi:hypothetical protein